MVMDYACIFQLANECCPDLVSNYLVGVPVFVNTSAGAISTLVRSTRKLTGPLEKSSPFSIVILVCEMGYSK